MPAHLRQGFFTFHDLMRISGKSADAIKQACSRNEPNMDRLESVLIWCAKHARPGLRTQILAYVAGAELPGSIRKAKTAKQPAVIAKKAAAKKKAAKKKA